MSKKKIFSLIFLCGWALGMSYLITLMHAWHYVDYTPEKENLSSIQKLLPVDNNWSVIHVLGQGCGCSELVSKHIIKRGPLKDTNELVIVVGEHAFKEELKKAGFKILELPDYKSFIKGVPMMVIFNNKKEIKYAGGYAQTLINPTTQILDIDILQQIKKGKSPEELKVMGCSVSKKLQKILDPLNLKYTGV